MIYLGYSRFQSRFDLNFDFMIDGLLLLHAKELHELRQACFSQLMAFLPLSFEEALGSPYVAIVTLKTTILPVRVNFSTKPMTSACT